MSSTATAPAREARPVRRAAPLVVLGTVLAGGAAVAAARSAGLDVLPACPFHALTGLDCPGCGATRAVLALGRGDLGAAVSHHALLVLVVLPLLALAWVAWARAAWHGRRGRATALLATPVVHRAIVVTLVVFTVVRNVPGVPLLDAAA